MGFNSGLKGLKNCNIPPSDGWKNSPFFAYLINAVCVCPLYQGKRQADNIHFHPYPLQNVTIDFHDDSDDPSSQLRQSLLQR
jgi:hypothetical protein